MDRLLDRARQEQEWGVPPILEACLVTAEADPPQGRGSPLSCPIVPSRKSKPNIVPKIGDQTWANSVFDKWEKSAALSDPVKKSIKQRRKDGNVRV